MQPCLTLPLWEVVTEQARIVSECNVVAYSPFLYTQAQRSEFYDFTVTATTGATPVAGDSRPYLVCGTPDLVVTNPDTSVPLGGTSFSCRDLEGADKGGFISRGQNYTFQIDA